MVVTISEAKTRHNACKCNLFLSKIPFFFFSKKVPISASPSFTKQKPWQTLNLAHHPPRPRHSSRHFLKFSVLPISHHGRFYPTTLSSRSAQLSHGTGGANEMRPRKESKRRSRPSSPIKDRTRVPSGYEERSPRSHTATPGVSLLDRDLVTEDITLLEELSISQERVNSGPNPNPRSFPYNVKQQCWEKAEKIKGRDPDRWRRDALGNIVFRKLVGCPGCLCHDYDHIVPYSKGGPSTLENCQVLQATVNRSKGNRTEFSRSELIQKSSYCRVSGRDMDLLELSAYGNVRQPPQDSGGCRIQ